MTGSIVGAAGAVTSFTVGSAGAVAKLQQQHGLVGVDEEGGVEEGEYDSRPLELPGDVGDDEDAAAVPLGPGAPASDLVASVEIGEAGVVDAKVSEVPLGSCSRSSET